MTAMPILLRITPRLAGVALGVAAWVLPAAAQDMAVVSNRVIYPGQTIEASALEEIVLRKAPRSSAAFAVSVEDLEGKIARRTLLPGKLVPLNSVREAYLVERGASVQMVFAAGALTISATAVTLEPGSAGDMIKLRNLDSGKVISGVVMADGTVRVGA